MVDLKEFYKKSLSENICEEYIERWDKCKSKKQIIDMALSVKAIDYICDSIAKGWGISSQYICDNFIKFINGNYISEQKGYTSAMFCQYDKPIYINTTTAILIDCNCTVYVDEYQVCELFLTGKSKIQVEGNGDCVCVYYGDPNNYVISSKCPNIKYIHKIDRDHNE